MQTLTDEGYDYRYLRLALCKKADHPAHSRAASPKNQLGRYRGVVERTLSYRFRAPEDPLAPRRY